MPKARGVKNALGNFALYTLSILLFNYLHMSARKTSGTRHRFGSMCVRHTVPLEVQDTVY
jgi:hypothetical protein